jgi:hypothetical protein
VGLERGPLSLVSATEELLERNSNGSGLENRDYGRKGSAMLITNTLGNDFSLGRTLENLAKLRKDVIWESLRSTYCNLI